MRLPFLLLLLALCEATASRADDVPAAADVVHRVTHRTHGVEQILSGRLLVRARDGGLLLETAEGRLETITPANLVHHEETREPFRFSTADERAASLQAEFGPGFEIVRTTHYIIITNASPAYGRWCGRLFERLQTAFLAHWKRAGLELAPPQHFLVAVILATPEEYARVAQAEAGGAIAGSLGFYSVRTNRMVLADLARAAHSATERELTRRLESQLANVATLVHEATHQLAFNCGLQRRYADNPMWLSEGLAMYCEAPDLRSTSGWGTIGKLHPGRLQQFREFAMERRGVDSLKSLVMSEDRFRDPATAADAYAESWALSYYLLKNRPDDYVEYLRLLGAKPRLVWETPEQRAEQFTSVFGPDWEALDREMLAFLRRQR
jgi:hypothetical protein